MTALEDESADPAVNRSIINAPRKAVVVLLYICLRSKIKHYLIYSYIYSKLNSDLTYNICLPW